MGGLEAAHLVVVNRRDFSTESAVLTSTCIRPAASVGGAEKLPRAECQLRPTGMQDNRRILSDVCFMSTPTSADPVADLLPEVAQLVVTALNLEMAPAEIDPDAPLYGEGLGLDSIDILEVALAVSKQYGFQLRADDENNASIYASLRALTAHIAAHRTA